MFIPETDHLDFDYFHTFQVLGSVMKMLDFYSVHCGEIEHYEALSFLE